MHLFIYVWNQVNKKKDVFFFTPETFSPKMFFFSSVSQMKTEIDGNIFKLNEEKRKSVFKNGTLGKDYWWRA